MHLSNWSLNSHGVGVAPNPSKKGGRLAGSHAEYKRFLNALDGVQCSIGMTLWRSFIQNRVGPINPPKLTQNEIIIQGKPLILKNDKNQGD